MDALSYRVPDADEIIICPYNSSHAIEVKRMPYHLMKCRRQHVGQDFATCPFNAKHELPKPELRYHVANCPDRNRIAADLSYEQNKNNNGGNVFKGCTDVPSYDYDFELPKPTEDWDSETLEYPRVGVPAYVLNNPNLVRNTVGLTRSEKKAHTQYLLEVERNGGVIEEPPMAKPQVVVEDRLRTPQSRPDFKQNLLARAGVGRGSVAAQIAGLDAARKPGMTPMPQYIIQLGSSSTSSATESTDDGSGYENGQSTDDLKKRQKKLQKKLRQIQALEDKQDQGEKLTPEELEKASKREEIEKALQLLNVD